jgi:hypothetical protein
MLFGLALQVARLSTIEVVVNAPAAELPAHIGQRGARAIVEIEIAASLDATVAVADMAVHGILRLSSETLA